MSLMWPSILMENLHSNSNGNCSSSSNWYSGWCLCGLIFVDGYWSSYLYVYVSCVDGASSFGPSCKGKCHQKSANITYQKSSNTIKKSLKISSKISKNYKYSHSIQMTMKRLTSTFEEPENEPSLFAVNRELMAKLKSVRSSKHVCNTTKTTDRGHFVS